MTPDTIEPGEWIGHLTDLQTCGWATLETLTVIDRGSDLEVVAVLRDSGDLRMVSTQVSAEDASLPSVSSVLPAARWLEREAAEMFGLTFVGHPDPRPLLLRRVPGQPPLRRSTPLVERTEVPWPGAREPGEVRRARRRALPPGVRESWVGEQA